MVWLIFPALKGKQTCVPGVRISCLKRMHNLLNPSKVERKERALNKYCAISVARKIPSKRALTNFFSGRRNRQSLSTYWKGSLEKLWLPAIGRENLLQIVKCDPDSLSAIQHKSVQGPDSVNCFWQNVEVEKWTYTCCSGLCGHFKV